MKEDWLGNDEVFNDEQISKDPHLRDLVKAYEEAQAKLREVRMLRKDVYRCRRALANYIGITVYNIR